MQFSKSLPYICPIRKDSSKYLSHFEGKSWIMEFRVPDNQNAKNASAIFILGDDLLVLNSVFISPSVKDVSCIKCWILHIFTDCTIYFTCCYIEIEEWTVCVSEPGLGLKISLLIGLLLKRTTMKETATPACCLQRTRTLSSADQQQRTLACFDSWTLGH